MQAEAALKLGILHNKRGEAKESANNLQSHFDLLRQGEVKVPRQIDSARVNLGIVRANQRIEEYKHLINTSNKLQELVKWKVTRDHKSLN